MLLCCRTAGLQCQVRCQVWFQVIMHIFNFLTIKSKLYAVCLICLMLTTYVSIWNIKGTCYPKCRYLDMQVLFNLDFKYLHNSLGICIHIYKAWKLDIVSLVNSKEAKIGTFPKRIKHSNCLIQSS